MAESNNNVVAQKKLLFDDINKCKKIVKKAYSEEFFSVKLQYDILDSVISQIFLLFFNVFFLI